MPTLLDVGASAGEAHALTGDPFWVFTDADGRVAARHAGELGAVLERLAAEPSAG